MPQGHIIHIPLSEEYGVTMSETASGLPNIPQLAVRALVHVELANIRERQDGTDPVGGVGGGWFLQAGWVYEYSGYASIAAVKLVRNESDDAIINVKYFEAR